MQRSDVKKTSQSWRTFRTPRKDHARRRTAQAGPAPFRPAGVRSCRIAPPRLEISLRTRARFITILRQEHRRSPWNGVRINHRRHAPATPPSSSRSERSAPAGRHRFPLPCFVEASKGPPNAADAASSPRGLSSSALKPIVVFNKIDRDVAIRTARDGRCSESVFVRARATRAQLDFFPGSSTPTRPPKGALRPQTRGRRQTWPGP